MKRFVLVFTIITALVMSTAPLNMIFAEDDVEQPLRIWFDCGGGDNASFD